MKGKMLGLTLVADWDPKPGFKLGAKDIEGRQSYLGSQVWRNPRFEFREYDIPTPGPEEVLIEVKACGICGSDVHMAQADEDGYIFYPGLTGFPSILGHEFSGVMVEAGKNAFDKRTNKPFKGGERVTSEEMLWCGQCKPCADGYPNHCERLDEIVLALPGIHALKEYPATLERLQSRGEIKELVIALDSDWHTKPQVAKARLLVAEEMLTLRSMLHMATEDGDYASFEQNFVATLFQDSTPPPAE